jgi:thymidine kinase
MNPFPRDTGWIEMICGSMFSGKSSELIRRLRLATIAKQKVQVFKHGLDTRYDGSCVVSHDQTKLLSTTVDSSDRILEIVKPDTDVVGIDEVQFFDERIIEVCESLANNEKRVIVAGLDQDFRGKPFKITTELMAVSEYITKNLAICTLCGNPANRNQRISLVNIGSSNIDVGSSNQYEARCRKCFIPGV